MIKNLSNWSWKLIYFVIVHQSWKYPCEPKAQRLTLRLDVRPISFLFKLQFASEKLVCIGWCNLPKQSNLKPNGMSFCTIEQFGYHSDKSVINSNYDFFEPETDCFPETAGSRIKTRMLRKPADGRKPVFVLTKFRQKSRLIVEYNMLMARKALSTFCDFLRCFFRVRCNNPRWGFYMGKKQSPVFWRVVLSFFGQIVIRYPPWWLKIKWVCR